MTPEEFCRIYSSYYGEKLSDVGQLTRDVYNGEELKELIEFFIENSNKPVIDENKITRFEVIDHTFKKLGRVVVKYDVNVELSVQDDGRTLKVFLTDKKDKEITKEEQRKLIIKIMEDDEKDGIYDYPELEGTVNLCNEIIEKRNEISDVDIEIQSWKYNPVPKLDAEFIRTAFTSGAKWCREQFKFKV